MLLRVGLHNGDVSTIAAPFPRALYSFGGGLSGGPGTYDPGPLVQVLPSEDLRRQCGRPTGAQGAMTISRDVQDIQMCAIPRRRDIKLLDLQYILTYFEIEMPRSKALLSTMASPEASSAKSSRAEPLKASSEGFGKAI